ncbi:hypothetical protein D3C76_924040 [compost metagenome]
MLFKVNAFPLAVILILFPSFNCIVSVAFEAVAVPIAVPDEVTACILCTAF